MIFSSYAFVFAFLPLTMLGFWLVGRMGRRAGALWLVFASFAFYAQWRLAFVPLLIASILFNYAAGQWIARLEHRERLQGIVLWTAIIGDLLALIYFKYAVAAVAFFNDLGVIDFTIMAVALPLGISFFTFTQIGYLVDVKEGEATGTSFLDYVLFVTFFPHLIAGPVLHNTEITPQFRLPGAMRFNVSNVVIGLSIFAIGLVKKTVLADALVQEVAAGFDSNGTGGVLGSWFALITYSLQLYFDFSGYSDMAIGLARMVNVTFPANFNSPLKATSIVEFWQRWHMSFTRWITLYIFNPIALRAARRMAAQGRGGPRAVSTPAGFVELVVVPTAITMTLAGVWHGAGFQFLIFGLLHGFYIVVNHASRIFGARFRRGPARMPAWASTAWKVLATYGAALVAFAFFRAASTGAAIDLLSGCIGLHGLGGLPPMMVLLQVVVMLAIVWGAPNSQQIMLATVPVLGRLPPAPPAGWLWHPNTRWAALCGIAAGLGVLAMGGTTEFLYFQF